MNAGQKLLHIKNEIERNEIKTLMETLEGQWKVREQESNAFCFFF
jgi:hypothetical protein